MNKEISEKFAEAAQGTCMSIQEVLCHIDEEEWPMEELDWGLIEDITFNCSECGWWCEAGDYNTEACEGTGEEICSECEG